MFVLARASVCIACPRDLAFGYAARLEHFPAWFPGVHAVVAVDDQAFDTVGKRYDETLALPLGARRRVRLAVVEVEPGARLVTQGQLPLVRPRMEMVFQALDAAHCRVDWCMVSRSRSRLAHRALLPLVRRVMTRRAQDGLQALRRHLEGLPPAVASARAPA